jgi:hypothetical protein
MGITMAANFGHPAEFDDDWMDRLYVSLEGNVALVSKDVFTDEAAGTVTFLLGVQCPDGLDSTELVEGIARDAVDKAIREANGEPPIETAALPVIVPSDVATFA